MLHDAAVLGRGKGI